MLNSQLGAVPKSVSRLPDTLEGEGERERDTEGLKGDERARRRNTKRVVYERKSTSNSHTFPAVSVFKYMYEKVCLYIKEQPYSRSHQMRGRLH